MKSKETFLSFKTIYDKIKIGFLDTRIWQSMELHVRKCDLNEKQSIECTAVENFLKKIIIDKYERNTSTNNIYKSNHVVKIHMRCTYRNCNSTFKSEINIETKECEITFVNICKHNPLAENQNLEDSLDDLIEILEKNHETTFNTPGPLSISIWKSHDKFSVLDRSLMNEIQLEELDYIDLLFKEKLTSFNFATNVDCVTKTQNGYILKRICIKRSCDSNCTLRVEVPSGFGTITKYHDCNHY